MLVTLRRWRTRFAMPQFHWNACPQAWDGRAPWGDAIRAHECQLGAGHDGPHRCHCGATRPKAVAA